MLKLWHYDINYYKLCNTKSELWDKKIQLWQIMTLIIINDEILGQNYEIKSQNSENKTILTKSQKYDSENGIKNIIYELIYELIMR